MYVLLLVLYYIADSPTAPDSGEILGTRKKYIFLGRFLYIESHGLFKTTPAYYYLRVIFSKLHLGNF